MRLVPLRKTSTVLGKGPGDKASVHLVSNIYSAKIHVVRLSLYHHGQTAFAWAVTIHWHCTLMKELLSAIISSVYNSTVIRHTVMRGLLSATQIIMRGLLSVTQLWGDYCQPQCYVITTHLTWLLMRMGTRLLLSQFFLWTAAMPSNSFLRTPTWVIPICPSQNRWALFLSGTSCYKITIMIIALISIVSYLTDKVSTLCFTG